MVNVDYYGIFTQNADKAGKAVDVEREELEKEESRRREKLGFFYKKEGKLNRIIEIVDAIANRAGRTKCGEWVYLLDKEKKKICYPAGVDFKEGFNELMSDTSKLALDKCPVCGELRPLVDVGSPMCEGGDTTTTTYVMCHTCLELNKLSWRWD